MEHMLTRLEWLAGKESVAALQRRSVAVFGCGGVGSFAIEGLVRSGVGRVVVIDGDVITPSNLNRQLIAEPDTIGRRKALVTAERAKRIRPEVTAEAHDIVYTAEVHPDFIKNLGVDFVIDAVDMVTAKLDIIEQCHLNGIPCISSMGAGNKMQPELLRLADINRTHTCPLAKVIRKELRKRGIKKHQVVFSPEAPITPVRDEDSKSPGSCMFVPSVAGLLMSGYVLRQLLGR